MPVYVKYFLGMFIFGLFIQCDKEPVPRLSNLEVPVVTGFEFKDDNNYLIGSVGIPNNNIYGDICDEESNTLKGIIDGYYFVKLNVYPNPCSDYLRIELYYGGPYNIWIVKANYSESIPTQYWIGSNNFYAGGAPIISIKGNTSSNIVIGTGNLEPGYYRLYVEYCNTLLWENVLVSNGI